MIVLCLFFRVLVANLDQEDKEDQRYHFTFIHSFFNSVYKSYSVQRMKACALSNTQAVECRGTKTVSFSLCMIWKSNCFYGFDWWGLVTDYADCLCPSGPQRTERTEGRDWETRSKGLSTKWIFPEWNKKLCAIMMILMNIVVDYLGLSLNIIIITKC